MKRYSLLFIIILALGVISLRAAEPEVEPSYAWRLLEPLGLRQEAVIDTMLYNYYQGAIPSLAKTKFYNTRIPMSIVSYNTGGGREIAQDYFRMLFSGNFSPKGQIGAFVDYPYSKGSYNYQAAKGLSWGQAPIPVTDMSFRDSSILLI